MNQNDYQQLFFSVKLRGELPEDKTSTKHAVFSTNAVLLTEEQQKDSTNQKVSAQQKHAVFSTNAVLLTEEQQKDSTNQKVSAQQLANLPDEILALPRFVNSGNHGNPKAPFDGWNLPENQRRYSELSGIIGFVPSTIYDDSLIFLDFDHVLDDNGEFVNPDAEKWFNYLHAGEYFCELSQSKTGLHMFTAPTKGKFSKGRRELNFGDGAKLEIFYGTNKFCLVTGNLFRCQPKALIAQGNVADQMFQALLDEIKRRQPTEKVKKTAPAPTDAHDTPEYDSFRANLMLDAIKPADLSDTDWLAVISAAKNIGIAYPVVDAWNQQDPERYDEKENLARWNSLDNNSFGIETLHGIAKRFNYSEKDARRQWYQIHPKLKPSAKQNIADETKRELDDAIIWLDSLEPETFTADDARGIESIHKVALAAAFGFSSSVEKFFKTIKDAKALARNRIKESDADISKKLTNDELNNLTALVEGINIKFLRHEVDLEITVVKRAQNKFHARQARDNAKAEAIKHAQERKQTVEDNIQQLIELRAEYMKNPSSELAAQIQNLILHTCDVKIDRYTGEISAVKATQRNANLIFTYDPYINGLFGYDQFQQADVFLKAPPWRMSEISEKLPHLKSGYDLKETDNLNLSFKGTEWTDADDAQLQTYIRNIYTEFVSDNLILKNITWYSRMRAFHEVKEFFRNLPKWDGKTRAETLFIKFLKAEDSPYTREVTLNWLTAAVARIFHPGCDYQLAPVLLGDQGIGKSYLINKLGGKWYGSLVDDVSDPHAIDAIQKLWLVEIKEMAAMKKDIDANKRFIDSAEDTRRRAYERRATKIKRHCVFIITTNNRLCLTDLTGNRRYPVIPCLAKPRQYDASLTDQYIKQVWAEVFQHCKDLFKDGFDERKLELSRAAQIQSDQTAEQFTRDDLTEEIKSFLDTKIPPNIIWLFLTRDERRKFRENGNIKLLDGQRDLSERIRSRYGDKAQPFVDELDNVIRNPNYQILEQPCRRNGFDLPELWIYGSEFRQHICPAEIFHEAFAPTDRRISIPKILESLNRIDGWTQGGRYQKKDPAYNDQKNVFYRDTETLPL